MLHYLQGLLAALDLTSLMDAVLRVVRERVEVRDRVALLEVARVQRGDRRVLREVRFVHRRVHAGHGRAQFGPVLHRTQHVQDENGEPDRLMWLCE